MLGHILAGLLTGYGLIIAIGAQNAFVLRQGLAREHVGVVVAICTLSDMALIAAGTAGLGALVSRHHTVLLALRWVGGAYLLWFGLTTLWGARTAEGLHADGSTQRTLRAVAGTTLALTWLNPHVYLDTVLMLGTIAASHGATGRWGFASGAMAASLTWFCLIGFGARELSHKLASPTTWKVLDVVIGLMMIALAIMLVAQA